MDNNAQWVKPLFPGDIPVDTTPIWNTEDSQWEFISIVKPEIQANTANTL